MYSFASFVLILIVAQLSGPLAKGYSQSGNIKFHNLTCTTLDPKILTVNKCLVEKTQDNLMSMSMDLHPHITLTHILINGKVFRKVNTRYIPFFYDDTFNFCDFLLNPGTQQFWQVVYKSAFNYTNVNHTCPYDHDLIINGLALRGDEFKFLPLPRGDYMAKFQVGNGNVFIAKTQFSFSRL